MKHQRLRRFFTYFGGKHTFISSYPKPKYRHIIEPFAGSAAYATRYYWHDVTLFELNPVVFGIWDWLIKSSPEEILRLPDKINRIDEVRACQECKWFLGFWLHLAGTYPTKQPTPWAGWSEEVRWRIAEQVTAIRHWKVVNKSYEKSADGEATWFVDPPYQGKCGMAYKYRTIDYKRLGCWCKERQGQIIVCEQQGANWLPFRPFKLTRTAAAQTGRQLKETSAEVYWLKDAWVPKSLFGDDGPKTLL